MVAPISYPWFTHAFVTNIPICNEATPSQGVARPYSKVARPRPESAKVARPRSPAGGKISFRSSFGLAADPVNLGHLNTKYSRKKKP